MFKKFAGNPGETDTLIGEGSVLEGNLRSKASLRIEGKVQGDIDCDGDVTIGKNGTIISNVRARNVFNAGTIEGSIDSEALVIHSSGSVNGNIKVDRLTIAEGGVFQGTSKMEPKPVDEKKARSSDNKSNVHQLDKKKKDEAKTANS